MMQLGRPLAWALGLVLLTVDNAAANAGPGPAVAFGPLLLIVLLILLSMAGGAYPILAHLEPNRNRWWRIAVRWAGAIGIMVSVIVLPTVDDDPVALIGLLCILLVLVYLWLRRSIEMLWWAKQARSGDPKPAHLAVANPWRLGLTGVALLVLPILGIIALLNMEASERNRWKPFRAASDAKTAVTQGIVYANDHEAYPRSMRVLRDAGYANIRDADPWGNSWVFAPVLAEGRKPQKGDDVYVYNKGPCGTGTYQPSGWRKNSEGRTDTGKCGAIGYSSLYGEFRGQNQ